MQKYEKKSNYAIHKIKIIIRYGLARWGGTLLKFSIFIFAALLPRLDNVLTVHASPPLLNKSLDTPTHPFNIFYAFTYFV